MFHDTHKLDSPLLIFFLHLYNISGVVVEGMDVVDRLYKGYGEGAPRGKGPSQQKIQTLGNSYLEEFFPKLSYIVNAQVKGKV
jgi:hypothetical protein